MSWIEGEDEEEEGKLRTSQFASRFWMLLLCDCMGVGIETGVWLVAGKIKRRRQGFRGCD